MNHSPKKKILVASILLAVSFGCGSAASIAHWKSQERLDDASMAVSADSAGIVNSVSVSVTPIATTHVADPTDLAGFTNPVPRTGSAWLLGLGGVAALLCRRKPRPMPQGLPVRFPMKAIKFPPGLLAAMVYALVSLHSARAADVILRPDDQTAWIQKNDEFVQGAGLSADHWKVAPSIEVVPGTDGLQITANVSNEKGSPSISRRMPFDPTCLWLQFDISDVQELEGYRGIAFSLSSLDTNGRGCVRVLQEGRYVTRVTPGPGKMNERQFHLRINLSGFQFVLRDLCMKSDPLPRLEAHPVEANKEFPGIGDEMKVTVYLAEPAGDVSVELFHFKSSEPILFGGNGWLQLQPEDSEKKIWSETFVLQEMNVAGIPVGEMVPAAHLLFKAKIIGGNFPQPLLNWNEAAWDVVR